MIEFNFALILIKDKKIIKIFSIYNKNYRKNLLNKSLHMHRSIISVHRLNNINKN